MLGWGYVHGGYWHLEWASLRMWRKIPTSDFIIILVVTLVTVFIHNLAYAVLIGVIIAALVFVWQHSTHLKAIAADKKHQNLPIARASFLCFDQSFQRLFNPQKTPKKWRWIFAFRGFTTNQHWKRSPH